MRHQESRPLSPAVRRGALVLLFVLGVALFAGVLKLKAENHRLRSEIQARGLEHAAQLEALSERVAGLGQGLRAASEETERSLAALAERTDAGYGSLRAEVEGLDAGLDALHESQARTVHAVEGTKLAVDELGEAGESVRRDLEREHERLVRLAAHVKAARDDLVERQSKAETMLLSAREDLEGRLASIGEHLEEEYASLRRALPPGDREAMVRSMLLPTVRVNCHLEVGSGTIVASVPDEDGAYHTFILTALHVVSGANEGRPVQVTVFDPARGTEEDLGAELVSAQERMDLALLELEDERRYENCARLASPERLESIDLFTPVYALGCPLGYAPFPTEGELSSKGKVLQGERYWMINAPTIFGNSGGGIYLAETRELFGVLTRVSAYNNFINIAVPHMGILVPLGDIGEWLDEEGYRFIADPAVSYLDSRPRRRPRREHPAAPGQDNGTVRAVLR